MTTQTFRPQQPLTWLVVLLPDRCGSLENQTHAEWRKTTAAFGGSVGQAEYVRSHDAVAGEEILTAHYSDGQR